MQLGALHSPVKRYFCALLVPGVEHGVWDVPQVELLLLDDKVEHLVGAFEVGVVVFGVFGPILGGFIGIATPATPDALSL